MQEPQQQAPRRRGTDARASQAFPRGGSHFRGRGRNGQRRDNGRRVEERGSRPAAASQGPLFPPHWTLQETAVRLTLGQCFSGVLRVNVKSGNEGYITLPDMPQDIMFRKGRFHNRAIVGDTVAFRIMPTRYWWVQKADKPDTDPDSIPCASDSAMEMMDGPGRRMALLRRAIRKAVRHQSEDETTRVDLPPIWDHVQSPDEAKGLMKEVMKYFPELRPTAEVVAILDASPRRGSLIGVLQSIPETNRFLFFLPLDTALPKRFLVPVDNFGDCVHRLYKEATMPETECRTILRAQFLRWEPNEEFPTAIVCDILGQSGDIEVETKAILHSNGVSEYPFPDEVLSCLPQPDWQPSEIDLQGRSDFRDKRVFSIDPPTARDLDDALSIEQLEEDLFRVGVHIADVSHFVTPGTPLDYEAQRRTTSVYLVQRVIPMLPELLSSHLCSLQPGEDRLSFSVVWEMTKTGEILKQEINKSVICSCTKLAYHHAQTAIDDPTAPQPTNVEIHKGHNWEEVKLDILNLFEISQSLRRKRRENGALRLDLPKICFKLDENGLPELAQQACQTEANHLIEEFMLLANMTVARLISDMYPAHALLRNHPPPNFRLMGELLQVAGEMKIDLDVTTAGTIQKGLWQLHQKCGDADVMDAITNIATRSMQLAEYFCTGLSEPEKWSHYALAVERYTHFTSPIRRYPDIIVHRLLYAAITVGERLCENLDREEAYKVHQMAANCNRGKLSARNAQDATLSLFFKFWLERKPVQTYGVVASVKGPKFFDVYVPRFALSARVVFEELPGNLQAEFDRQTSTLTISKKDPHAAEPSGNEAQNSATKAQNPDLTVHASTELEDQVHVEFEYKGDKVSVLLQPVQEQDKEDAVTRDAHLVDVAFLYHTDSITLSMTPVSPEASSKGDYVHVDFTICNEEISVNLRAWSAAESTRRPSVVAASSSRSCPAGVQGATSAGDLNGGSMLQPLEFPFQITRFCKIPVKVWVQRCAVLGKLTDVRVDLILSDV